MAGGCNCGGCFRYDSTLTYEQYRYANGNRGECSQREELSAVRRAPFCRPTRRAGGPAGLERFRGIISCKEELLS